ncbi:MAG TPA: hypothetical protein EYG69_02160 [Campylobacterales bacterium]|nr:hypothetical protein [Campylobacterales bacterium]
MNVKLEVRLFHFNVKSDYLAYYTKNKITIDDELKVKDLLVSLESKNPRFSFKKSSIMLQINGISIKGTLTIKKIVELFGKELTVEPISTYRAIKDLDIDDNDFIEKYSLLEKFGDEKDFKHYTSLKRDYYASNTLIYNRDYYGDSMFAYASYLIEKYPENESEILTIIDSPDGIRLYEFEDNIYPKNNTKEIVDAIKEKLPKKDVRGFTKEAMAYYNLAQELVDKDITPQKIKEKLKRSFKDFKLAYYGMDRTNELLLLATEASIVSFDKQTKPNGFDIVSHDKSVAYKKAGEIALDAYDSGAEILVVDSAKTHFMIDQSVTKCESATGRDIRIPVVNIAQIIALALGHTNKEELGLDKHKIELGFI